ncbi:UNVERIFIED_CONTAM: hypothetical protein FKN15_031680 [Acipenser sinensis]
MIFSVVLHPSFTLSRCLSPSLLLSVVDVLKHEMIFSVVLHPSLTLSRCLSLSLPLSVVDVLKHEVIFSVVRLAASFIICLGFLLLLLPEEWDSMTLRFLSTLAEKKGEEPGEELSESSVHTRSRSRANGAVSIPLA